MTASEKPTIALDPLDLDVLSSIRALAPEFDVPAKRAEAYGVWVVCYRRYCSVHDIPWLWMSSVSKFMDFLDTRDEVSEPERNRALDGIMFYLADVRRAEDEENEKKNLRRSRVPSSTRSLFGQLLLRCNIQLTQALQLRVEDVKLGDSSVVIQDEESEEAHVVEVPASLRTGLKKHLERLRDRTEDVNPYLFGHRAPEEEARERDEADPERSTRLATLIMEAFDEETGDASGDGKSSDGKSSDGKSSDGKPGDGKPGDGKPGDGKPGDGTDERADEAGRVETDPDGSVEGGAGARS